jgi:hypothetical protein
MGAEIRTMKRRENEKVRNVSGQRLAQQYANSFWSRWPRFRLSRDPCVEISRKVGVKP